MTMIRHIWLKELLKLNKMILAIFIVNIGFAIYFWLNLKSSFSLSAPVGIWIDIIEKQAIFFGRFEDLITYSAVALGIMQFYPEVEKKRFRISCHLPVNEYAMTGSMLIFGISILAALFLMDMFTVYFIAKTYFTYEFYSEVPIIMYYWFLKSVVMYTFVSVITLEPSWKKKIVLAIVLSGIAGLIGVSVYNSDRVFMPVFTVITLLFIPVLFYSMLRFRKGE